MERTEVDGVPVLWAEGPAPMTATLVFGCGARDESFRTIGVTHLIEHLAMSKLPRVHYEHNACVELETTEFHATGRPEQIVEFLDVVCRALGDLPLERMDKEAGVLAAEGGAHIDPTSGTMLARRFGTTSYGLAPWAGPGYDRLTPEMVTAYAARFFTKGNAVLTITGPPPEGLRLPLPEGERPARETVEPLAMSGPQWSQEGVPAVGLALLGPNGSTAASMGLGVLQERLLQTARRDQGISYEVSGGQADLDPARTMRLVVLDAREGREAEAATVLWNTARDIATLGPEQAELDHEIAGFAEVIADPRACEVLLDHGARCELFGFRFRPMEQVAAELAATTPAQVAETMAAALRTALLVVPEDCEVALADLDGKPLELGGCVRTREAPAGTVLRPKLFARAIDKAARRARLVLTADGIAYVDGDGDVHYAAFTDVVGVEMAEDARILFTRGGCVIPVDKELFSGVDVAIRAIDAAVPAELRYQSSELS